jgi:hypothetical protein
MTSKHISDDDIIQSFQKDAPSELKLTIHHQLPGIELVSPVYAGDGITCSLSPDQKVNFGSTTQAGFNIDPDQVSTGILMYRLQRESTDKSDEEAIYSKEKATCVQLVIIWKANSPKGFCINSFLIDHDKGRVWDKDKLMNLVKHCKLFNIRHGPIEDTCLMHDHTVLMTNLNIIHEEERYKLEITISEGSINEGTWRPLYIGLEG